MDGLTAKDILSLYAPLIGIIGLAFWMGKLTGQLTDTVRRVLNLENGAAGESLVIAQLARLEERVNGWGKGQEKIDREVQGIQRTLANWASGKGAVITKFEQD